MSKCTRGKKIYNLVPGINSNKEGDIDENFEFHVRLPSKCKEYGEMSVDRHHQQSDFEIDDTAVNKTYTELRSITPNYDVPLIRYNDTIPPVNEFSENLNIEQKEIRFTEDGVTTAVFSSLENIPEAIKLQEDELYEDNYGGSDVKKKINENNLNLQPEEKDEETLAAVPSVQKISETINLEQNKLYEDNCNVHSKSKSDDEDIIPPVEISSENFNEGNEMSEIVSNLINIIENQNSQTDRILEQENNVPPPAKKKRIKEPEARLKLSRDKHPMGTACKDKCIRKCTDNITEEQRQMIWDSYWNMDVQRRRDFISRNVENNKIATRYSNSTKRNHTYVYKLLDRRVCKTMFLRTLGYTNDQAVLAVMKANFKMSSTSVTAKVSAAPDLRGRHQPKHGFSTEYLEEIDNFIELFHPTTSHYRLEHAPNRRYLPTGLTLSQMYIFLKQHLLTKGLNTCSWATFHKRIQLKNISTQQPLQDKCPKCEAHDVAHPKPKLPRDENLPDHSCLECNCEVCGQYPQHIINKNISRDHMNMDNLEAEKENSSIGLFTVDMQKCVTMPQLYNKEFFFSRKLNLFNETFASIGKGNKPATTMLWHEGESGRKAFDVATAYILFLQKYCRDYKTVILYADNCNAQNKNKILYSALLRLINDCSTDIETIKIEYLEPGHTYMSADSVHGCITNKLNSTTNLFDLNDYVRTFAASRKNLTTHVHNHNDVMLFKNELKSAFPKNYNISAFKIVEFRRGKPKLFVKTNYTDTDFMKLDVLTKTFKKEIIKTVGKEIEMFRKIPKKTKPEGISKRKKNDLLKLLQYMPKSRHQFFENLTVNEDITEDLDKSASETFD